MQGKNDESMIRQKFQALEWVLDERLRRLVAAAEAEAIGYGGPSMVSRATGVSRRGIRIGAEELKEKLVVPTVGGKKRIRREGGGRKKMIDKDPTLKTDLEKLVDPLTRGDPDSPLRWTCKSVRRLADELKGMGHQTSHRMVAEILHDLGYSLKANKKTLEGTSHPDRDAQFEYINRKVQVQIATNNPVISVDTKKKELVGNFKNDGQEWEPKGMNEEVNTYDFLSMAIGKGIPYGVYDPGQNKGWISVGIDHDTSTFAVETIRRWWYSMGRKLYPNAQQLLITADGGGSNGYRVRLWKMELQNLANELGFPISVCHFPPGTSKWNKIEHHMFSFITQNWRGKPLVSHEVMVNLIGATTTKNGLGIHCELDTNTYPIGRKISKEELEAVNIKRNDFHGEWNYTIYPSS